VGDVRMALEAAVRDSDGGRPPKGWPDRYEPVIDAVVRALEPGEQVRAAWRMRSLGPRERYSDVGLVVATDRRVLGADHNSKGGGMFAIAAQNVVAVALEPRVRVGSGELGVKIRLLDEGDAVLGSEDSPAEFQVFAKGHDPSIWDTHVRGNEDLASVQETLVQLLPSARASAGALPATHDKPVALTPDADSPEIHETVGSVTTIKKGTVGAYLSDVVVSMLFPVWVLWLGPRYLLRGELLKGIVLILIVAVEMTVALLLLTS